MMMMMPFSYFIDECWIDMLMKFHLLYNIHLLDLLLQEFPEYLEKMRETATRRVQRDVDRKKGKSSKSLLSEASSDAEEKSMSSSLKKLNIAADESGVRFCVFTSLIIWCRCFYIYIKYSCCIIYCCFVLLFRDSYISWLH